jgi:Eco47II restriction endonuclease
MPRIHLPFIDDSVIEQIVADTLSVAIEAQKTADTEFNRNVIDPFAALFEMKGFNLSAQQWLQQEKNRQAQKTLANQLGDFHQRVLGAIDGWENAGRNGGLVDVIHPQKKIICEIKNKHNTIKASDQKNLYEALEQLVMPKGQQYKGYTAYYVQIIPKNAVRFNKEFTPSDNAKGSKKPANPLIRTIDGWSFYRLATGVENALEQLFDKLPALIGLTGADFEFDKTKQYFNCAYVHKIKAAKIKESNQASQ